MGPVEFHLLKGPEVEVPRFMLRTQSGKGRAVFRSETRSEAFRAGQHRKERPLNGAEGTLAKAASPKKGHGQTHATQQQTHATQQLPAFIRSPGRRAAGTIAVSRGRAPWQL